jgi:hypothetical protein
MAEEFCTPRHLVTMKDPSSIPIAVAMAGLTLPLGNLFDPVNIIILDRRFETFVNVPFELVRSATLLYFLGTCFILIDLAT